MLTLREVRDFVYDNLSTVSVTIHGKRYIDVTGALGFCNEYGLFNHSPYSCLRVNGFDTYRKSINSFEVL